MVNIMKKKRIKYKKMVEMMINMRKKMKRKYEETIDLQRHFE